MSNSVSEVTATPNRSTPWERARLDFVSDPMFSPEEQKMLETGTPEKLQEDILAWDKEHAEKSTMRKLGNRLKPIISGLGVFGSALDVFAQIEPKGVLAAVWGTIRVLLAAGGRLLGAFEEIVDQMTKLGPSLQRLDIMTAIHSKSARLDTAVFQVFKKYLECVKTVRMIFKIEKPGDLLKRLKEKITKARKLITYQESFAESLHEVESSCIQAEKEAGLADTQAAAKFYREQKGLLDDAISKLKGIDTRQNDAAEKARTFYTSQSEQYKQMISLIEKGQSSSGKALDTVAVNYEKLAGSLAKVQIDRKTLGKDLAIELYSQFAARSQTTMEGLRDRLTGLLNARANDLEMRFVSMEDSNKEFQQEQRQRWEEKDRRKLQKAIEEWLSPFNFLATQDELFGKAAPTADWLISHPVFKHWTEGVQWQIRLYGEAGVGKVRHCHHMPVVQTMLSSMIINYLQGNFDQAKRPVLCLYMNYKEDKMHTREHLFGSLLKQLLQLGASQRPLPTELVDYYERAMSIGAKAKFREINQILRNELSTYERLYVVIDALDECSFRYRFSLLQDFQALCPDRLSLIITERPDSPIDARGVTCNVCHQLDKKEYYRCRICNNKQWDICLDCKANGGGCKDEKHVLEMPYNYVGGEIQFNVIIPIRDLKAYVEREITKETGLGGESTPGSRPLNAGLHATRFARILKKRPELLLDMPGIIAGKADGRFLFAKLYWETVKAQLNAADIQETLENLPEKLSHLYQQIVKRVREQDDTVGRKLAFRVLARVFFAKRPLSLAELQHMLATRSGDKDYNRMREVDSEDILQSTAGLITIEAEGMAVKLSHQTLEEYFQEEQPAEFAKTQLEMASECLTVIDYAFPSSNAVKNDLRGRWPLATYASEHWGDHVAPALYDESIKKRAMAILGNSARVQTLVKAAWETDANNFNSWDAWKGIHPLHVSAWFGLAYAIYQLAGKGEPVDITEPTFRQTPLIYACRKGQHDTVAYLVAIGADVNHFSARGSSPLFEAIEQDQIVVMGHLLDSPNPEKPLQVNIRHPREFDRTPLMMAIHHGNPWMVYKLLGHSNVDVNARDRNGQTALILAARNGSYEIAEQLLENEKLEKNAADLRVKRTALICAAEYNQPMVVKLLLDRGADPNLRDRLGGTALMRGIDQGRKSVVSTMLGYPAVDKHCLDTDGRGLLHAASANGDTEVLDLLRDLDLDMNLQDSNGMTPLHEAARCGKSKAVATLLAWGFRADTKDASKRTASVIAWQYGFEEITSLLATNNDSDSGLSNTTDISGLKLPPWALVRHARTDLLKSLVEQNDTSLSETEPGTGNTVLHIAILTEQISILEILLPATKRINLSIDAQNRHLRTPLHLAVIKSSLPAVSLLLDHSASPSVADIWSATPLYLAIEDKRNLIALRLIAASAPIDARQSDIQRLFFQAVEHGNVSAASALLAAGADKNGRTLDDGLMAYQIAKKEDVEMQRFLKVAKTFAVEEMMTRVQQQQQSPLPVRRRDTGLTDSATADAVGLKKISE
ncbi:MAG: hypothetical protein Q9160_008133 [Pyrenula sp. 1 TL-2023]